MGAGLAGLVWLVRGSKGVCRSFLGVSRAPLIANPRFVPTLSAVDGPQNERRVSRSRKLINSSRKTIRLSACHGLVLGLLFLPRRRGNPEAGGGSLRATKASERKPLAATGRKPASIVFGTCRMKARTVGSPTDRVSGPRVRETGLRDQTGAKRETGRQKVNRKLPGNWERKVRP